MSLALPQPLAGYDPLIEQRRNEALRQADAGNHKKSSDIELGAQRRLIMTSPNGARWGVTMSDAGVLTVTAL